MIKLLVEDPTVELCKSKKLQDICKELNISFDRSTTLYLQTPTRILQVQWTHNKLSQLGKKDVVVFTNAGQTQESEIANRKAVCNSCPQKLFQHSTTVCKKCGCSMTYKWKQKDSTCPLDFWK